MWYLNPFINGYGLYDILLEISPRYLANFDKLIASLVRAPEVEFVTELTGVFQLSVTVRARNAHDVAQFVTQISSAYPGSVSAKEVSTVLSLTDIPMFRSARQSKRRPQLSFAANCTNISLDVLDERILALMRSEPEVSLNSLARKLGIPATTVTYRIRGLKESGAILGARFFIDVFRLGYSFAIHRVSLTGEGLDQLKVVEQSIQSIPGVYFTMTTLSRWDITFGTVTHDMQELSKCTAAIASQIGSKMSKLETVPVKRFYKLNGAHYKCR